LRGAYPGAGRVREEKSLAIDPYNLPEPDIVVLRSDSSAYVRRHPSGPETLLVVELSWSSQRRDRRKASIYAAGGVDVYWILDLETRRLEVRTAPVDDAYQVTQLLGEDDVIDLPESEHRWTVRDLLP